MLRAAIPSERGSRHKPSSSGAPAREAVRTPLGHPGKRNLTANAAGPVASARGRATRAGYSDTTSVTPSDAQDPIARLSSGAPQGQARRHVTEESEKKRERR